MTYSKNDAKYRFEFTIDNTMVQELEDEPTEDDLEVLMEKQTLSGKVDVRMVITEVEEEKYCVQFSKVEGDQMSYKNAYDTITKEVLSFAVDQLC